VLRWARETIGLTPLAAARRIDVPDGRVDEWEAGTAQPSVAQLRKVAEVYRRSLGVFFLPAPPLDFDTMRDFRRHVGAEAGEWSPELHAEYRRAIAQREAALELAEIDEAAPPTTWRLDPLPGDDEAIAAAARSLLLEQSPLPLPRGTGTKYEHLNMWAAALEEAGVLVMATSGGKVDTRRCAHSRCTTTSFHRPAPGASTPRPRPTSPSLRGMAARESAEPDVPQRDSEETFDRLVDEGEQRLGRSWSGLVATGFMGGVDVGAGVLALLLVEHVTDSKLLGGLAFSIGFIALTLARSELFTENFLVPVVTVVAKQGTWMSLGRLWGATAVTNLAGGWVVTAILMVGFPTLRETAVESGTSYVNLGFGWRAFALAVVGGLLITLMTHMQHASDSEGVQLVPAVAIGFLLGAGQINHAIVASLMCFAALQAGAPFGYLDWLGVLGFAVLGNMVGGLGLVTLLRLLQVPDKVREEREQSEAGAVTGEGE